MRKIQIFYQEIYGQNSLIRFYKNEKERHLGCLSSLNLKPDRKSGRAAFENFV